VVVTVAVGLSVLAPVRPVVGDQEKLR
jgi:hypothetical protein